MPTVPTKCVRNLVESKSFSKVSGNQHKRACVALIGVRLTEYIYHNNVVCVVNEDRKKFYLDDCGWGHAPSTRWTLNSYEYLLSREGYTKITKEQAVEERWGW